MVCFPGSFNLATRTRTTITPSLKPARTSLVRTMAINGRNPFSSPQKRRLTSKLCLLLVLLGGSATINSQQLSDEQLQLLSQTLDDASRERWASRLHSIISLQLNKNLLLLFPFAFLLAHVLLQLGAWNSCPSNIGAQCHAL